MAYNEFAYYYDSLMDEEFYEEYKAFILPFLKNKNHILELGCGTGAMSIVLAKEGKRMHATDLSSEMVEIAEYKADLEGLDIEFSIMDMREFNVNELYEAILCLTDGINYLHTLEDVQKVFDQTYHHLKEDGIFIFDVHSIHKVDVTFLDYHEYEKEEDYLFDWHVRKIDEGKIEHHVVIEDEGKLAVDETHIQTTFTVDDYIHLLEKANFKSIHYFSDFKEYDQQADRVIFIVKKG